MINGEEGTCASQRRICICEGMDRGGSGDEDWSASVAGRMNGL